MDSVFTPEVIEVIVGAIGAGLLALLGKFIKSSLGKSLAEKVLSKGIEIAFHAVEDHAAKTPNKIDDKVALGLKFLAEYLATHGLQLTENQVERAKLTFSALHAQSKAQVK